MTNLIKIPLVKISDEADKKILNKLYKVKKNKLKENKKQSINKILYFFCV